MLQDGGRSSGGNWRDGGSREWSEVSSRRPLNRTRSLSSKYDVILRLFWFHRQS